MASRGWYAEKQMKLKKERIKQMKETDAIAACASGYARRSRGENSWVGDGTRTYAVFNDEERKRKDYPQILAMEIANNLFAKYGITK